MHLFVWLALTVGKVDADAEALMLMRKRWARMNDVDEREMAVDERLVVVDEPMDQLDEVN